MNQGLIKVYQDNENRLEKIKAESFELGLKNYEYLEKVTELNNDYGLLYLRNQNIWYNQLSDEDREFINKGTTR